MIFQYICTFNLMEVEGRITNGLRMTAMYWEASCRLANNLHLSTASMYLHLYTFIDVQASTTDLYEFLINCVTIDVDSIFTHCFSYTVLKYYDIYFMSYVMILIMSVKWQRKIVLYYIEICITTKYKSCKKDCVSLEHFMRHSLYG